MIHTIYSLLLSMLLSVFFVLTIRWLWKRGCFLKRFGTSTISALYFVCALRMAFPFEPLIAYPLEASMTIPIVLEDRGSVIFPAAGLAASDAFLWVRKVFILVWLLGAAASLFFFAFGCMAAGRRLSQSCARADEKTARVFSRVQAEAPRRPRVDIYTCPGINVPMGTGIVHRRILLPELDCTETQLYYILKHEYAHFCSRDLAVKLLLRIFCCILWWNPAVYILKRDVAELMEIRADALAVSGFSGQERQAYIDCVAWVFAQSVRARSPGLSTALFLWRRNRPEDEILERVKLILWPAEKPARLRQGTVLLAALLIFLASYSLVPQPAYEPAVQLIATSEGIREVDAAGARVIRREDGLYSFVLRDGSAFPINESTIQVLARQQAPQRDRPRAAPRGDVIVTKVRMRNNRLQYRRWNETWGHWMAQYWVYF